MQAHDVMSRLVHTVTPMTTIGAAAELMRDHGIGFLPVVDDTDRTTLVGVVTDRDLVIRGLAEGYGRDLAVRFAMSGPPLYTAREGTDVHEMMALMERRQVRRLPILSASGAITGIVSQGDLALHVGPTEPIAIEALIERVSAPAWLVPQLNGLARLELPNRPS